MEGGVFPLSKPRCTGRMLQRGAGRGTLLLPPALLGLVTNSLPRLSVSRGGSMAVAHHGRNP